MKYGLDEKQLAFCRELAAGRTQKEAYAKAYGRELSGACSSAAGRLMKVEAVREELRRLRAEMRKELDGELIADKKEVLAFLTGAMRDEAERLPDRIRASQEVCKLLGFYEAEEHVHSVSVIGEVISELGDQGLEMKNEE